MTTMMMRIATRCGFTCSPDTRQMKVELVVVHLR